MHRAVAIATAFFAKGPSRKKHEIWPISVANPFANTRGDIHNAKIARRVQHERTLTQEAASDIGRRKGICSHNSEQSLRLGRSQLPTAEPDAVAAADYCLSMGDGNDEEG